ncbi:unnamed protein product [Zymoseptoria tritici ST99CH_3D7]|uniref:Transcription initiation factor TFIID subunit 2 n=1 Tax=Zymoseptoria tritici (strain ST99CH_3D7) TaxID=1276538 RepID=A0A1X7RV29_ZYMT9|nr:unnamed protein product [Zymoseptoria tritici ST99CH_3D7]
MTPALAMSLGGEDGADAPGVARREYEVLKQRVDLDLDFPNRSLKGSTEITLQPLVRDLRTIRLHCRQCRPSSVQIGGIASKFEHNDPYRRSTRLERATVNQHGMLKGRMEGSLKPAPEPTLDIQLPPKLKIQELHVDPATSLPLYNGTPSLQRPESDAMALVETPIVQSTPSLVPQFAPIKITIEFEVPSFRDGIHWVGCMDNDKRYPYMYTKLEPLAGNTSCIFPCIDDATSRCTWDIAIRCPRTLGDAFRTPKDETVNAEPAPNGDVEMVNGTDAAQNVASTREEYLIDLAEDDAALELTVLCVGEMSDDVADTEDETRHTVTFSLNDAVTARHVGLAVGPFEHVDLTSFRATEDETRLGQTAVKIDGYCLPGRSEEVENTCFPIHLAADHMSVNYGRFPFASYQFLFVDDLIHDTTAAAGLTICSNNLLFKQDIIEPLDRNTRILVRAVAEQWSGVNIVPKEPTDAWVIAGIAGYMTDVFMKKLAGNNQYRWEQKIASEKVYDLDVDRPSIQQLGSLLHLDASIPEFLNLKSALVLGILDRRLIKSSGSTGVTRIINKIFLNAKTGSLVNGELSTYDFQRTCERLGHNKLESFFRQWVQGAGCPIFYVTQRFNKKKLVVEMTIVQRQLERKTKPPFEPSNFMREIKEHVNEVYMAGTQNVFTGPMTIRIHEADGTPYEHIVEIKEPITKLEIPYNTKYKRLKRSRRQKERAAAEGNPAGEGEEALLYCLGDILDTPEDIQEWELRDWTAEDEDKMGQESYEWIRMDADFEWIGKIHLVLPLYMYVSQLQQDRDLVAQHESMRYILGSNPHHTSLSILLRTLMDHRYFYGIRVMAAEGLAVLAKDDFTRIGQKHLTKAFEHLFCDEDSVMPRPNDFSNRVTFIMQCAIPQAMARLRDADGKVPRAVQQFFVDKLKFNDNSDNEFSDCHYVSTLMTCLTDSLVASHREVKPVYQFDFGEDEPLEPENPDAEFEALAVGVIERYRRIDEWVLTYQNVYSTTAIECLQKLTNAGIVKDKSKELLQYTRPSTAPNVRLQAFRCLIEMGVGRKMSMIRHILHNIVNDHSPHFRDRLMRHFGEALGHIALDDDADAAKELPAPVDGLVLEQEAGDANELRRIEATRRTGPEGAIEKLKAVLLHDETFKKALWYAATSPDISIDEVAGFCDVAALIYEAVTSHTVIAKLPRPYRAVHEGKGKLRFSQHGSVFRTKPSTGLALEDWQTLESLGLRYTGPLAEETTSFIAKRRSEEAIKSQIAETQRQPSKVQTLPPLTIPLKPATPMSTPIAEKSGIKLSFGGGLKRKSSVDHGSREGTPKSIKTSKAATPASVPSPAAASQSKKANGTAKPKKLVKLRFGIAGSRKVEAIIKKPHQPGARPAPISTSGSLAASASLSQSPMGAQSSSFFSPPPPQSLTSMMPPTSMNVGGFRSFGGSPEVGASFPAPPPGSVSPALSGTFSGSPQPLSSLTRLSPTTNGTAPTTDVGGSSMAPPPLPKKKLTLKLSNKSGASPAQSPKESPDRT